MIQYSPINQSINLFSSPLLSIGLSLSSDAFFPFRDSIDVCAKVGVKYVAQPGGSIQDQNVVDACNEYGMAMCATGVRLFHH